MKTPQPVLPYLVTSGDFCGQQQSYKWFILAFDNCYWNCCRKLAEAVNPLPHSNCRKFVQQLHSICWNHQVCYKNNKKAYLLIISVHKNFLAALSPSFYPQRNLNFGSQKPFSPVKEPQIREQMSGPGLHVFTLKFLALKKIGFPP